MIKQLLAVILAGMAVGVADALIKKTAISGSFISALKNPLMIAVLLLYVIQIIFFLYAFIHGWKLGILGNIQMVFYSITVILSGFLIFGETLSLTQTLGIILAIIAVILMNL